MAYYDWIERQALKDGQQAAVVTAQTIAPGQTFVGVYEDMDDFTLVSYSANAEASHDFTLGIDASPDGAVYGATIGSVAGVSGSKSTDVRPRLRYLRVTIKNNDTVAHTYNVWRRGFTTV